MNSAATRLVDPVITNVEHAALMRLLEHARGDSGQSRMVADFLLAWWNSESCGAFDLSAVFGVDAAIAADMVIVFALIARVSRYPDALGFGAQFEALVSAWRPQLDK